MGALSAALAALFCRVKADSPVRLRGAAGPERAARNARDHHCLALRLRIRGRSCPRSYAEAPGERWARLRQHFPPLWCREGARERGAGGRGPCCHNSGICMHRTSCGSTVYRLSVRPFKRLSMSRLYTLENGKRTSQNKQLTNRPAHKPNPMEGKLTSSPVLGLVILPPLPAPLLLLPPSRPCERCRRRRGRRRYARQPAGPRRLRHLPLLSPLLIVQFLRHR